MGELYYKDLSYLIIGCNFKVFNELGYGYREKVYQRALIEEFRNAKLRFRKECPTIVKYNDHIVGKYYFDFLIEDKIIVEIKVANDFYSKDIKQILSYLKAKNLKLGILIIYTRDGIKYRRFVN